MNVASSGRLTRFGYRVGCARSGPGVKCGAGSLRSRKSIRAVEMGLSPTPPPPTTASRWSCTGPMNADPEVSISSGSRRPGIGVNRLLSMFQNPGTRPWFAGPYPAVEPV